ncbi:MAG TPA: aminotransferase class III-fold pyridoxal phosphate-dependent enzyme [Candidatus Limnocylindria bacterium]|nr:aminotransferase class III-fold pyridoxal phosphate-dependent enzyme [Candidatus Limnocylindria bacterium]
MTTPTNQSNTRFWHGFADMHVIKDHEIVIASGDGAVITDTSGKEYIDATAALWFCNAGYGRREIADAVAEQLTRLHAYSSFGAYTTDATLRVAERLTELSPIPNAVVFLASGGSDAIDTAGKLARRYWDVVGKPNKTLLVSREHAYHGMHAMGTSLGGMPIMQAGYGGEPFINEVVHVPALDVEATARVFEQRRDEIAAFVGEPVIGAGGVIPPTDSYWRDINALCKRYDVLLIADEVITGFGRMGRMWGSERFGIEPDMITFAKGVTSGYMPLGGVLVGERVSAPFWDEPIAGAVFRHGYTYSGHSGAAAAALANLDIIERERLVERVATLEPVLDASVRRLQGTNLVGEIRTIGLTAAVAIKPEILEKEPTTPDKVVAAALRHGVASRVLRGHAIHISPPFVISEAQIDAMVDGIGNALEDVAAAGAATGAPA